MVKNFSKRQAEAHLIARAIAGLTHRMNWAHERISDLGDQAATETRVEELAGQINRLQARYGRAVITDKQNAIRIGHLTERMAMAEADIEKMQHMIGNLTVALHAPVVNPRHWCPED